MLFALPFTLLSLVAVKLFPGSHSTPLRLSYVHASSLLLLVQHVGGAQVGTLDRRASLQTTANGSTFIWTIQDTYAGDSFFE